MTVDIKLPATIASSPVSDSFDSGVPALLSSPRTQVHGEGALEHVVQHPLAVPCTDEEETRTMSSKNRVVQLPLTPLEQHTEVEPITNKSTTISTPHSQQQPGSLLMDTSLPLSTMTYEVETSKISSPRSMASAREDSFNKNISPHMRRNTYSVDTISHHALDRLGVNADIVKKEKGMKKLGICDDDLTFSEELRRYAGITRSTGPSKKVELVFGFNDEQLHRVKAIKQLGTTEQEVFDEYCRRISKLGTHKNPTISAAQ